jgi:uncharacterized protein (TIRG00374 family)
MDNAPAARPRGRVPSWAPQLLGYLASIVCLAWAMRKVQFSELMQNVRSLDWRWVAVAVAADLGVYICHAWRWNTLLEPVARVKFWRTVQAIYIGLFANEVLPLRVGELVRCYLLAHWNGLRLSLGFASAAVERVIDGFWMLLAFAITAGFVKGINPKVTIGVQILAGGVLVCVSVLVWVVLRRQHAASLIRENRWASTVRHVVEGLQLMGNPRTLFASVLSSLLYLLMHMFSYWALMKAYLFDFSFWSAAGATVIIRLLTVIPNAPGNAGVINWACIVALTTFGAEPGEAASFSIILFGALTVPLLIGGAVATALTGLNIGELRDRARRGMDPSAGPVTELPRPSERS